MKRPLFLTVVLLMAASVSAQTAVTCAEAAALMPSSTNGVTTETYIVTGYVTTTDGKISKEQQCFWMDDAPGSTKTIQGYWCNLPEGEKDVALTVGDKITVTGKIMNYNGSPEIKNGDVAVLERAGATPVDPSDFQQIVVQDTYSATMTFINDDAHPWTCESSAAKSPTLSKNQTTTFSVTFTSQRKTEVQFTWQASVPSSGTSHSSEYWLDGELVSSKKSGTETRRFILDAGTHTLSFRDTVWAANSSYWTKLSALRVREIVPLEWTVLAEGSMPLTFANNGEWPWTTESGYIQNSNYGKQYTISRFSTTFTLDEPAMLSFEIQVTYNSSATSNIHQLQFRGIYDSGYAGWQEQSSWGKVSYVLDAGTHSIAFLDTLWGTTSYYSRIRNISLAADWRTAKLAYAGTLGSEVLNVYESLYDAELLKIKGPMNSTDWNVITQMTNLKGLDLSEAEIAEIPENAFSKQTNLSYISLPEGLITIGSYAFQNTRVIRLRLPSTVKTIADHAFYQVSGLSEVIIPDNSQLTTIGASAFSGCTRLVRAGLPNTLTSIESYAFSNCSSLQRIVLPNTVTTVGTYAFNGCSAMDTIILSDALTTLPESMCNGCKSLRYIHLPSKVNTISTKCFLNTTSAPNTALRSISFPESLRTIAANAFSFYSNLDSIILPAQLTSLGANAFESCTGTKYIKLPSYIAGYSYNFKTCSSLQKVVCPSATPPTITNDPFSGGAAKSNVVLEVPSFAMAAYKLDSYWYKFGTISEGEEPDYWRISGDLVLTDNSRMSGSPTVDITTSGRLTSIGSQPLKMRLLEFNCSNTSTSALVNSNAQMTADSVRASYNISTADKWFFITPPYDLDLSGITHGNGSQFIFRYYDGERRAANGTGSSWQNITEPTLKRGQGYILQSNGTGWLTLRDKLKQGQQIFEYRDVAIALETHAAAKPANENWNLIGNPYPCYYDIWYLEFTTPITVWTGSTYKAYSIMDDNYALRPMQAFFVQKPATLDNLVFHKEGRQVNTEISHAGAPARTAANSQRQLINLSIAGAEGNTADETRVVINPSASMAYETTCDASKFMSMETDVPQIYSLGEDGVRMSINERPLGDGMIALGCYAGHAGEYTISAPAQDNVTLIDQFTGTTHDFADGGYTFTADQGDIMGRFYLNVTPRYNTPTAIQEPAGDIRVVRFAGGLAVDCTATAATVYSVDGRVAGQCAAGQGWMRFFLPAGIYIVQGAGQNVKQIVE